MHALHIRGESYATQPQADNTRRFHFAKLRVKSNSSRVFFIIYHSSFIIYLCLDRRFRSIQCILVLVVVVDILRQPVVRVSGNSERHRVRWSRSRLLVVGCSPLHPRLRRHALRWLEFQKTRETNFICRLFRTGECVE